MRGTALLLTLAAAGCAAESLSDFAGTWVQHYQGRNFRVLSLHIEGGTIVGTVTQPRRFTIDSDGDIVNISPQRAAYSVRQSGHSEHRLDLNFDGDVYSMTLAGEGQASLRLLDPDFPFPSAPLVRAPDSRATVAASWPVRTYPKEIRDLQKRLNRMVKADQAVRTGEAVSVPKKMEAVDAAHRSEVLRIHERYGWPAISLAGKEASHNYWLLVQHQDLEVQREILPDLERAANRGEASKTDFAYLFDRVQVNSGKPQHWGSQVACRDGKPELSPTDDLAGLEQRRRDLHMIPLDRYLIAMEGFCAGRKLK